MPPTFMEGLRGSFVVSDYLRQAGKADDVRRKVENLRSEINELKRVTGPRPMTTAKPSGLRAPIKEVNVNTGIVNAVTERRSTASTDFTGLTASMQEELTHIRENTSDATNAAITRIVQMRRSSLEFIDATTRWRKPDETAGLKHLTATLQMPSVALLEAGAGIELKDLQMYMNEQAGKTSWLREDVVHQLEANYHQRMQWKAQTSHTQTLETSLNDTKQTVEHQRQQIQSLTVDRDDTKTKYEQTEAQLDQVSSRLQACVSRDWHKSEIARKDQEQQEALKECRDQLKTKYQEAVESLKTKQALEKTENSKSSDGKMNDLKLQLERAGSSKANAEAQLATVTNKLNGVNNELLALKANAETDSTVRDNRISELSGNRQESHQNNQALRDRNTELWEKERAAQTGLERVSVELSGLKAELDSCRTELARSAEQNTDEQRRLTGEIDELKGEVDQMKGFQSEYQQLLTEGVPDLQQQIERLTLERNEAKTAYQTYAGELQAEKTSVTQLTNQVGILTGQTTQLEGELRSKTGHLAEADERNRILSSLRSTLEERVANLEQDSESLRSVKEQLDKVQKQNQGYRNRQEQSESDAQKHNQEHDQLKQAQPALKQARTELNEITQLVNEYLPEPSDASIVESVRGMLLQLPELTQANEKLVKTANEANEENSNLITIFGPLFGATLPVDATRENMIAGLLLPASTADANKSFIVETAQPLEWDMATVPSSVFTRYPMDDTLPLRLWLNTCYNGNHEQSMTLIELTVHALSRNLSFGQPESSHMVLAAASNLAGRVTESQNPETTAICALRAVELALRFGVPINQQLLTDTFYRTTERWGQEILLNPLLLSLAWWLKSLIDDPKSSKTLLDLLEIVKGNRVQTLAPPEWNLPDRLMRRTLLPMDDGVVVSDRATSTISQYQWDDLDYSFECDPWPMYTVKFNCERRLNMQLSVIQDAFQTDGRVENELWFVNHMPMKVKAWSREQNRRFGQFVDAESEPSTAS